MSKIKFCKGHNRLDVKVQVNFILTGQGKLRKDGLNMAGPVIYRHYYFYVIWMVVGWLLTADVVICGDGPDCPEFTRLGCFRDELDTHAVPELIMTDRDTSSTVYGGRGIDWNNINEYLKDLVCRCATKTKSRGFRFFALRELGECWSGAEVQNTYGKQGPSFNCKNFKFDSCQYSDRHCFGDESSIAVYVINETHPVQKAPCPAGKAEHHETLQCSVYNLTALLPNTSYDDYLWYAHSPQFIKLRAEFEVGILQVYDGYDPFIGVTTLRFSKGPDDTTAVHFVIEFKEKGAHLSNLTKAIACGNLGKFASLAVAPALLQIACYKAPAPPVCPIPCSSACAPFCYSSCCTHLQPFYYALPPPPPLPATCPHDCPNACAHFGCTPDCCNNDHSPEYYHDGKRHHAPKATKMSHIFRKLHGNN